MIPEGTALRDALAEHLRGHRHPARGAPGRGGRASRELRPARGGDEPRGLPVPGDVHARSGPRRARRAADPRGPPVRGARRGRRRADRALEDDRARLDRAARGGAQPRGLLQGRARLPEPPRPAHEALRVRCHGGLRHGQHPPVVRRPTPSAPTRRTRTTPTCTRASRSGRSRTPATSRSTRRCIPPTARGCSS